MRVAYLPLDDRPVNYDYLRELAALVGYEVEQPPREWLGNPWRASRHDDLVEWLEKTAGRSDALILALDTLGYGGLVPSRTSNDSPDRVLERLSIIKTLKTRKPQLIVLGYNVILRICRANSAEEEKEYWAEYGSRLFRLSSLEHKTSLDEASSAELQECNKLRTDIPDIIYNDYLQGRKRNHAVNLAMLDWLEAGILDYLILPQDDTADYGWNIAEARKLQFSIRMRGLSNKAITYPGADETANLLLARLACQQAGFVPRIWVRYASQASANTMTAYEDRPIHELIKAHLAPVNGYLAESPKQADLLLFVNAPAEAQGAADLQLAIAGEWDGSKVFEPINKDTVFKQTRREMSSPRRNVEEFIRAMKGACDAEHRVALADVAFVNGADLLLGQSLMQSGLAARLVSFAGWNTAGNTLGTVLTHAILNLIMQRGTPTPEQMAAHALFLFRRYMDDYYYQAIERSRLMYEDLPRLALQPTLERLPAGKIGRVERILEIRLCGAASQLREQFVKGGLVNDVRISNISLPWQRLFEIAFDVQVELP